MAWIEAQTAHGQVALDPSIGNIRRLDLHWGGRVIAPLHTAPWVEAPVPDSVPPVEARLAGDFFCAPFGAADLDGAPPHGAPANTSWTPIGRNGATLRFRLDRPVMGARITKTLRLSDDAPLLYQTHRIDGGDGRLPVAHHPMIHLADGGTLSVSPKRIALSPPTPLEPGRNRLALDRRVKDITRFPAARGGVVDLRDLPIGTRHEDFVTLVETPGAALGWTAVLRAAEDDIVFVLKSPAILPVTMLWHSNGGRDYAPWNARHRGVLGIEDGCAAGAAGHAAALAPNPVAAEGVATALRLGGSIRIPHVIGAVPRPQGWKTIAAITAAAGQLTLQEAGGGTLSLPFDTAFLDGTR
ncbi:MAG: hypothetical protein AAGE76_00300 [Pseudomonadota bacterium]